MGPMLQDVLWITVGRGLQLLCIEAGRRAQAGGWTPQAGHAGRCSAQSRAACAVRSYEAVQAGVHRGRCSGSPGVGDGELDIELVAPLEGVLERGGAHVALDQAPGDAPAPVAILCHVQGARQALWTFVSGNGILSRQCNGVGTCRHAVSDQSFSALARGGQAAPQTSE